MNNNSQAQTTSPTSPKAYAVFVRLYMEWMDKEGKELGDISISGDEILENLFGGVNGPDLDTDEFVKHIEKAWNSFLNSCPYVEKFDSYIGEVFSKNAANCKKVKADFAALFNKILVDWKKALEEKTVAEFNIYILKEFQEMKTEIEKQRSTYDKQNHYPMASDMFCRYALWRLLRLLKEQEESRLNNTDRFAALARIFAELVSPNEEEFVKRAVRNSGRRYGLRERGPELFGKEFGEFVNQTWERFYTQYSDVDDFAAYLQNEFEQKMKYPTAKTMFNRYVGQAIYRLKKDFEKEEKLHKAYEADTSISLDDDNTSAELNEALIRLSSQLEDTIILKDLIACFEKTLDETDKKILELAVKGCTEREIGAEIGISAPAVSKRRKKMKEAFKQLLLAD